MPRGRALASSSAVAGRECRPGQAITQTIKLNCNANPPARANAHSFIRFFSPFRRIHAVNVGLSISRNTICGANEVRYARAVRLSLGFYFRRPGTGSDAKV